MELTIQDLSHDGRGVARNTEGKTVFVEGALVGEKVLARIQRRQRQFDEATIEEILQASPQRVAPKCVHFGLCGGCSLQHLAPSAQIEAKQRTLLENLDRIGRAEPRRILAPVVASPWGYRRRGRLSVKYVEKKGKVLVGFRETNGRYVADLQSCEVAHPAVGQRLAELSALIGTLTIKHAVPQIEFAVAQGDLAVLVFRHLEPLAPEDEATLREFAGRNDIVVYLQPKGLDSVHLLHPESTRLFYALDEPPLEVEFRPLDFIQINAEVNEKMVAQALALLAPRPQDRILDLFCGLGNFTLPLARHAASVVGVDGDAGLIERARENAARNALPNASFHAADLAQDHAKAAWAEADYDAMVLDPPRVGAEAVLKYLPKKSVKRIVYVSCHPGSLARDTHTLVHEHGFTLEAAGAMDMFPHTAHVESMALFTRC